MLTLFAVLLTAVTGFNVYEFSEIKSFNPSAFRSISGVGNNIAHPHYGAAFTNKFRIAPTLEALGDLMGGATVLSRDMICRCATKLHVNRACIWAFHTACSIDDALPFCQNTQNKDDPVTVERIKRGFRAWCSEPEELTGFGLPSARVISNALFDQPNNFPQSQYGQTSWVWAWGQFIDHDTAADSELGNDEMVEFCKVADHAKAEADFANLDQVERRSSCFQPIEICCKKLPPNDPRQDQFFSPANPIRFFRSPYNLNSKNIRKYLNIITSFVDGSQVYGSSQAVSDSIRDLSPEGHGRLATDVTGKFAPIVNIPIGQFPTRFIFGDVRGNENRVLTSLHTLFIREHNRIADGIWKALGRPPCNLSCNNKIFQKARAYVVGLLQKITYEEWLPAFLGPEFTKRFIGKYKGYNPKLNPALSMEFTVASFRVGHTMINEELLRGNARFQPVGTPLKLSDIFQRDAQTFANNPNEMRELVLGLGAQLSERVDEKFIGTIRNMLFGDPRKGQAAFDLPALNLQRSRDNGVARINEVRRRLFGGHTYISTQGFCKPYTRWDQLVKRAQIRKILNNKLYHSFNLDIVELFVGGLLEDHLRAPGANARMGETFAFINAEQFRRLRDADRFWYERYLPKKMVAQIKADSLANVLERNLGVGLNLRHRNVFQAQPTGGYKTTSSLQNDEELNVQVASAQEEDQEDQVDQLQDIDQMDEMQLIDQSADEMKASSSSFSPALLFGAALVGVGFLGFYFEFKSDQTVNENSSLL